MIQSECYLSPSWTFLFCFKKAVFLLSHRGREWENFFFDFPNSLTSQSRIYYIISDMKSIKINQMPSFWSFFALDLWYAKGRERCARICSTTSVRKYKIYWEGSDVYFKARVTRICCAKSSINHLCGTIKGKKGHHFVWKAATACQIDTQCTTTNNLDRLLLLWWHLSFEDFVLSQRTIYCTTIVE